MLEFSFYFNLGAASVAALYVRAVNGSQAAEVYTSTSIVFSTFVGTVLFPCIQACNVSSQSIHGVAETV